MRVTGLVLSLALVTGAHAGAVVKITSNEPARVAVDGEDLGVTPITLRDMKPGKYEIKLENVRTGMLQSYAVKSPDSGTVEREIAAKWTVEAEVAAPVVQVAPVAAPVAVVPVAAPAPAIQTQVGSLGADAPPAPDAPPAETPVVPKTKARNVLLGAALANEVFNKGKSKKTVRQAAIGLGLLNEAIDK